VIHYKKDGLSGKDIAQLLSVSACSANRIYLKYQDTGEVEDLERQGRPTQITEEEKEDLLESTLCHPDQHLGQLIQDSNFKYSRMSASKILKEGGMQYKTRSIKWLMSAENRAERLAWAKEYESFSDEFWKRVVFTDESKVQYNNKKQKVWVTRGTTPDPVERDRWQVSVMGLGSNYIRRNFYTRMYKWQLGFDNFSRYTQEKTAEEPAGLT
jgi:transposase